MLLVVSEIHCASLVDVVVEAVEAAVNNRAYNTEGSDVLVRKRVVMFMRVDAYCCGLPLCCIPLSGKRACLNHPVYTGISPLPLFTADILFHNDLTICSYLMVVLDKRRHNGRDLVRERLLVSCVVQRL